MACFRILLLIFMVIQNSSVVLIGRYSRASQTKDKLYVVNHLIIITEVLKLLLALIFELKITGGRLYQSIKVYVFNQPLDCLKIMIPSLLYLLQNSLLYVALSNLTAPLFQVTYQSKLLTTAIVSVIMLNRKYNVKQWVCLTFLGFGVAIVVLGETDNDRNSLKTKIAENSLRIEREKYNFFRGIVAVTIACFSSALAGVYFEMVLKKPLSSVNATKKPASLWMRNIQMAFFSICIACLQLFYSTWNKADKPFMYGFTIWVWIVAILQAAGGLLVAAVIKYADNVLKGMATGVSVVFATGCSVFLFDTTVTLQFFIGATMILLSVYFFNNDFPTPKRFNTTRNVINDIEIQCPLIRNSSTALPCDILR